MTPSRWREACSTFAQLVAQLGVFGPPQGQGGHAHDGVHGSTQFVAHVGEEGTLGAAGGFGNLLATDKAAVRSATSASRWLRWSSRAWRLSTPRRHQG